MNRNTRNLVILAVLVLAVVLILWYRSAREEAALTPLPSDTLAVTEDGRMAGALDEQTNDPSDMPADEPSGNPADNRSSTPQPTSLCADLASRDSVDGRPVNVRRVKDVVVYEGDPARQSRAARYAAGDSTYWVWKLSGSRTAYWIECGYEGNDVRRTRLPDDVTECTVAMEGSIHNSRIRSVSCT